METKLNGTPIDKYQSAVPSNPMAIPSYIKYNNELTQSKMTTYSEFASWNHLDHVGPYW